MGPVPRGVLGATALFIAFSALFQLLWPLRWRLIATWVVVEAIFFITVWLPRYDKFNRQPEQHEPSKHDAMKVWNRFLRYCKETPGGLDYKAYIKGWFRGADFYEIKRGNAEEFVAYGFWYRSLDQMRALGLGHVPGQMVEQLERLWDTQLQPGYNPQVKFLGHLWEPLPAASCYRPLLFYCSTEGVGRLGRVLLKRWGFARHYHNGLAYFTLNISKPKPKAAIKSSSNRSDSSDISSISAAATGSEVDSVAAGGDTLAVPVWATEASSNEAAAKSVEQEVSAASSTAFAAADIASAQRKQQLSHSAVAPTADTDKVADQAAAEPLVSVFELCSTTGSAEWTPFAPSGSSADISLAAARVADLPAAGTCEVGGSNLGLDSIVCDSITPTDKRRSGGSSIGNGGGNEIPWHSNGLRPASMSLPLLPRSTWAAADGADEAAAAAAAVDRGRPLRSSSLQPQRSPALSVRQALPQLAPRTSALLASLPCPLQEVLSVAGLDRCQPDMPMLFLHGVGGLPAYLELVMHLMATHHPVLAVEFKGVSLRLSKVYTADEVADTVVAILDRLQIKQACLVAHSYGTFIASLLLRRHPERVASVCLVDPVCFGMFMPNLLYNFLYRPLQLKNWTLHSFVGVAKAAVRKLASSELHLRATFSRRFYWSEINLWPEDLPAGSVVVLSGKDDLLDAGAVRDMLQQAGHVQVVWHQELTHGAFLLIPEVKAAVMQNIKSLLAASGNAVAGLAEGLTSLVSHRHTAATGQTPANSFTPGSAAARGEGRGLMRALASISEVVATGRAPHGHHDEAYGS